MTQSTTAEIFYPTLDYQLQDNPTVCAFKPSIEDMERYTQEGLMMVQVNRAFMSLI